MDTLLPIIDQVEKDLLSYAHSKIDYDRFELWVDHQRFREWCDHRGYSYDRITHPTKGYYYIEGEIKPEDM